MCATMMSGARRKSTWSTDPSSEREATDLKQPDYPDFSLFYKENLDRAVRIASRIVGYGQSAEDVAQRAFLAAWRLWDDRYAPLDPGERGRLLRGSVCNAAIDEWRWGKRRRRGQVDRPLEEEREADPRDTPFEEEVLDCAVSARLQELIECCLLRLTPPRARALRARLAAPTVAAAARKLGETQSWVTTNTSRALSDILGIVGRALAVRQTPRGWFLLLAIDGIHEFWRDEWAALCEELRNPASRGAVPENLAAARRHMRALLVDWGVYV